MSNILKRKNIRKEDYTFLKSIASRLIDKYPYLVSQISKDFILDKKIMSLKVKVLIHLS